MQQNEMSAESNRVHVPFDLSTGPFMKCDDEKASSNVAVSVCQPVDFRQCRKEGCEERILISRVSCDKHSQRCLKKGCNITVQKNGLCATHGGRYYPRKKDDPTKLQACRKEGCINLSHNVLCKEHRNLCSQEGCLKRFQFIGLCFAHGGRRPRTDGHIE